VVLVLDAAGKQVARVTSDGAGAFAVDLPPGHYRLVPQAVDGLMGTAPEQHVTIGDTPQAVTITYDTGIR
jgi:hypothetical protein